MPTSLKRSVVLLLVASPFFLSCGDDGVSISDVTSVSVSPGSATLASLGATQQLSATATAGTSTVSEATFTWSSSAPGVASVSAAGLVTAVTNGTATVTASVVGGTASGTASITVTQAAATISLSVADLTITPGATTQATATVADAGGSPIMSPSLSWSSSDAAVATVDATGLVTGVSEGQVTITASQDGASGTVDVGVIRPDLLIDSDQVLGGTVAVGTLTVDAGATVTLTEDAVIDASGPVTIAGTVSGDCTALSITGQDAIAVSGTLNTACVTTPNGGESAPGITISSPAGVNLTDAVIVASGPVTVTSEVPAAASARWGGPARAGESATAGTVELVGTKVTASPSEVPQPESPDDPIPDGADMEFRGSAGITLNGARIQAQNGGPGARISQTSTNPLEVFGGVGGSGGDIRISIPEGGKINFRTSRGATTLQPGDGGPGGPATATTTSNPGIDPAPSALAVGGQGGRGGATSIFGAATLVGDIGLIQWQVGIGGRGGNATAVGADGVDADDTRGAQVGGDATALAGPGGNAGYVDGGFEGMPAPDGKEGGSGGVAHATAGKGGDGIRNKPDGADGGSSTANGGRGGNSLNTGGRTGADAIADGGNGGNGADVCPAFDQSSLSGTIAVGTDDANSDPYIFSAGTGIGLSVALRILNSLGGPGGAGGDGGRLGATGGAGGLGREVQAPKGVPAVGSGANGGNGGAGVPAGPGGNGGSLSAQGDQTATHFNPVFQSGSSGGTCPAGAPRLAVGVGPAAAAGDRTVEINGSAPWVNVSGTIAENGTVTATGKGTVAGVPNIDVSFSGTYDAATGRLQGNYSMDTGHVISPGHPIVYVIDVSTGG